MIKDGIGAIAPLGSGETYGYHTLDQHIQDYPHNVTRFLVVKIILILLNIQTLLSFLSRLSMINQDF